MVYLPNVMLEYDRNMLRTGCQYPLSTVAFLGQQLRTGGRKCNLGYWRTNCKPIFYTHVCPTSYLFSVAQQLSLFNHRISSLVLCTHGSSINGFKKRPGTFYFPKEKNPKDIDRYRYPKDIRILTITFHLSLTL